MAQTRKRKMFAAQIHLLAPGEKTYVKSMAGILPRMRGQERALRAEEIIISQARRAMGLGQAGFVPIAASVKGEENCAATLFLANRTIHQIASEKTKR